MVAPVKIYLVFYNVVLTLGWGVILVLAVQHLTKKNTHIGLYDSVEKPLKIFQSAAILEVLHCAVGFVTMGYFYSMPGICSLFASGAAFLSLGIVPSSVVLTAFQVASRLFLTWAVAHSVPQVHDNPGVAGFVLAWSITEELFRFVIISFILMTYALEYRYTFFFFLYPIGVTGELVTIYSSLGHVSKSGLYSVSMPNRLNFSFDYHLFLIVVMFSYIPIFPQLYFHMIRQRKKVIGGKVKPQ